MSYIENLDTTNSSGPLELAIRFHEIYERLAPEFGYETRPDTHQFDPESKNGRLMVAVCGEILRESRGREDGTRTATDPD